MDTKTGVEDAFLGGPKWVSIITENEAQRRIDVSVSPNERKWIDTHQAFQELLADTDTSIGQILSACFTQHEAHLFVLSQSKLLKAIQEDNTHRFYALLDRRLQGVTPDIPTKLTMLYFGLPIEPIDFSLAELTYKMEVRNPEPPRYAVDPPLHFLTAYKKRNWGNEALIGKEDPSYPVPIKPPQNWLSSLSEDFLKDKPIHKEEHLQDEQPVLRLRGGNADDGSNWGEENYNDLSYDESDEEGGNEDGDYAEDTAEENLHRQSNNKSNEADDITMVEIDDDCDSSPEEETTPGPRNANWINLYGFQGFVPFIPGDRQTYEKAIRRLLSLGPQGRKSFSIVHFDEKSNKVDTIHDSLPLKPDSATLIYIFGKIVKEGKPSSKTQSSFFVKLKNESVPEHWQPSEEQFSTSVSSVRWNSEGRAAQRIDAPVSCCYLEFPKANDLQPSQEDMCGWDADQYNIYIKTAFEVLLGLPKGPFHHAFFRLGKSNSDFSIAPPVYGFPATSSSDILSLIPTGDGQPSSLRCHPLGDNEVAFVLPCYYNIGNAPLDWSGKNTINKALSFIRKMILTAFGDSAKQLKYVRLLEGCATLGQQINRNQKYYSIRMSDDLPQNSEIGYGSALSQIVSTGNPFVILHPEWEEDQAFLCLQVTDGDDGAKHYVNMPSLSSTVNEFRDSVFELMRLAGFKPSRVLDVNSGEAFISIRPQIEGEPANTKTDAPCFFIGPNTTDKEWFSIRARIPTPIATIKILDSSRWNWRAQAENTGIWGPRYGLTVGAYDEKKPEKKKGRRKEKKKAMQETIVTDSVKADTATAPLEEEKPMEASHADWAQNQPHRKNATAGSELRRRTWAAQPSIFENYGLLPWPANSGIHFPMNAPPSEHMLRTGSRMPMVSKAILTPTEQAELQRVTWDLRNLCLNRTTRCAYDGCRFAYRLDDKQAIAKHLKACHTARKCIWCDETILEHWDAAKIHRHMRGKHKDMLMEALGVSRATIRRFDGEGTISVPLKRVKRRHRHSALASTSDDMIVDKPKSQETHPKKALGFCDRCGRHANYYNKNEQTHHDSHCKPGVFNGAKCKFCTVCGKHVWLSSTDAKKSRKSNGQLAHCSHKLDDTNGPHCSLCGFNMSRLLQDGRDQHRKGCKGFNALSGRFCLYCGEEFRDITTQADWNRNTAHMVACYEKNTNAMSLLQPPDIAAFHQQQHNLRVQINAANLGVVSFEEWGQDIRETEQEDSDEEPRRPKPAKRVRTGRSSRATTDSLADSVSAALRAAMEGVGVGLEASQLQSPNLDARRHNQEALRTILLKNISQGTPEAPAAPSTNPSDSNSQRKLSSRSPGRAPSPDPLVEGSEKDASEPKPEKKAESPPIQDSSTSDSDLSSVSDFSEKGEQDAQQSGDEESEDELQGDPSSSGRRRRGGKRRGRKGDRNYEIESEDDEDDDSESGEDGRSSKPPRRSPSPNWQKLLGPEDPEFEPSDEFYCSKCFRKAPKKHHRDRSPLGRKNEIELHYDPHRCCGIRRGIGSIKRLPNRSGWIPAILMPKPLSNLRKTFLRRYPTYARTVYPLNASNANGSYYRSDPNNDDNKDWWSIPWPPFRGQSPLPNGWVAPDIVDVPLAGRGRQQFQLKPVPDPTYRQENNVQDSDDDEAASDKDSNGKRKRKSRPSSVFNSTKTRTPTVAKRSQKAMQKATTKAEAATAPRTLMKRTSMLQKMKTKPATPRKVTQQNAEKRVPLRRSTRKRQKTGDK
ncbi:hypothetical protein V8C37DRAFT_420136 [Trichoderma ceciliae]